LTRWKLTETDVLLSSTVHPARRRRLGSFAILAILVAATSLVLVIGPTAGLGNSHPAASPAANPGRSQPAATPSASRVLLQAGTTAGAQPGGWPGAAYWHSISSYRQGTGPVLRRESWAGHRTIGVLKDPRLSNGAVPLQDGRFAGFSWDQLYALPTDSLTLERQLRATSLDGGRDHDTELFAIVGDLLHESPAPPALRKALWEIAARMPRVTLVGAVRDSSGRSGVAVMRGDLGYILDTENGHLLEEFRGTSVPRPGAPGGANWHSTNLAQGPADSAPVTTPTRSRPTPAKG